MLPHPNLRRVSVLECLQLSDSMLATVGDSRGASATVASNCRRPMSQAVDDILSLVYNTFNYLLSLGVFQVQKWMNENALVRNHWPLALGRFYFRDLHLNHCRYTCFSLLIFCAIFSDAHTFSYAMTKEGIGLDTHSKGIVYVHFLLIWKNWYLSVLVTLRNRD